MTEIRFWSMEICLNYDARLILPTSLVWVSRLFDEKRTFWSKATTFLVELKSLLR